jgi:hypothetical protein
MRIKKFKENFWRIDLGFDTYDSRTLIGAFLRMIWFKYLNPVK